MLLQLGITLGIMVFAGIWINQQNKNKKRGSCNPCRHCMKCWFLEENYENHRRNN